MAENDGSTPLEPRHRQYGRSSSTTALWGHLLQKNAPSLLPQPTASSSANPPLAPTDRLGTSMRMLLHDTQATLEKFSDRVEKLTSGVDSAQQDVRMVQKLFQHEHENLIEEIVTLVNRCQLEIQKSIGKPAQMQEMEELRKSLASVERRVESLDKRFDVLHLLNQTQSQTLQTIQEQQSQLLSSLTPVLPLLQSIPLHIDKARLEIKGCVKDINRTPSYARYFSRGRTTTSSSDTLVVSAKRSSETLPLSSPATCSPSRKRRRIEGIDTNRLCPTQDENGLSSQQFPNLLSQPTQTQNPPSCSNNMSVSSNALSSPAQYGRRSLSLRQDSVPVLSPQSPALDPSVASCLVSGPNNNTNPSPALAAPPDLFATPGRTALRLSDRRIPLPDGTRSPLSYRIPRTPSDRPGSSNRQGNAMQLQRHVPWTEPQKRPASRADSPNALAPPPATPVRTPAPQNTTTPSAQRRASRRSRSSAPPPVSSPMGPASSPTRPLRAYPRRQDPGRRNASMPRQDVPDAKNFDDVYMRDRADMLLMSSLDSSMTPPPGQRVLGGPTFTNKPMSLKDRRARGLLTDVTMKPGKRYILLDDEEDDELTD